MNVVSYPNKRDWKYHADKIAAAWNKQLPSIIETGQSLIDAKAELDHGAFEAMVQMKLPFGSRTGQRLMAIAKHKIISNTKHVSLLPASWGTLYALTKLPDEILLTKFKDGAIHPKMERKDVANMRPGTKAKPEPASRNQLIAAIQNDPNANQRDAAATLGVSLGMYQRTRNELIGSGEIKVSSTLDDLRERARPMLLALSKEDRIREINRWLHAVDLNIHDWVSTMAIGKKGK